SNAGISWQARQDVRSVTRALIRLSSNGEPGDDAGAGLPAPRRAVPRAETGRPAYTPPKPPGWLREVVAAARAELEAAPPAAVQVDLGPARPEPPPAQGPAPAPGTARYRVDLRGSRVDAGTLRDLQLVPAGQDARRLPVGEVVVQQGDSLVVL